MLVAACGQRALRVPQVRKGSPGAHTAYHNVHLPRLSPALLSHCATPTPSRSWNEAAHTDPSVPLSRDTHRLSSALACWPLETLIIVGGVGVGGGAWWVGLGSSYTKQRDGKTYNFKLGVNGTVNVPHPPSAGREVAVTRLSLRAAVHTHQHTGRCGLSRAAAGEGCNQLQLQHAGPPFCCREASHAGAHARCENMAGAGATQGKLLRLRARSRLQQHHQRVLPAVRRACPPPPPHTMCLPPRERVGYAARI
jgi:hypothetical protein